MCRNLFSESISLRSDSWALVRRSTSRSSWASTFSLSEATFLLRVRLWSLSFVRESCIWWRSLIYSPFELGVPAKLSEREDAQVADLFLIIYPGLGLVILASYFSSLWSESRCLLPFYPSSCRALVVVIPLSLWTLEDTRVAVLGILALCPASGSFWSFSWGLSFFFSLPDGMKLRLVDDGWGGCEWVSLREILCKFKLGISFSLRLMVLADALMRALSLFSEAVHFRFLALMAALDLLSLTSSAVFSEWPFSS